MTDTNHANQPNQQHNTQQTSTDNPIVIAGGGLVGFSLALLLAKKGIASTLLEAKTFPFHDVADLDNTSESYIDLDSRNTALSRKTVQIYQALGLWEKLASHATPIYQVDITEQGGFGKARLIASEEKVESFGQVMENRWLGKQLLATALANPLITLIDNANISHISQTNQQVSIDYIKMETNQQTIQTPLLIAADGQDSFCRKALNIAVSQKSYEQTAVVAVVETDKPHQHIGYERFSKQGPLALLPLAGENATLQNRRSVVWIAKTGEEGQYLGTDNDAHFLNTLQHAFGDRAGKFLKVGRRGSYALQQILAEQQVKGRVVLLGNAAHTLHPVAGQGFNLCLRDANVLCDYLSDYLQSKLQSNTSDAFADFDTLNHVLQNYEKARLVDQKRVIKFCDTVVKSFTNHNPILKFGRNAGLLAFDTIPGMKQLVANYAMGLKS